ncbi:fimbrial protein [Enterobacter ludwigii]|uniref:fimbrial protein n=1 Tax=Enterobacter ludwigii TaxID=299767 RepID=UPI003976AB3C
MNNRRIYSVLLVIASLAALDSVQPLRADDPRNLEMKGTLISPPPCNLNGGNTVYVSFGDKVGTRKVASGVYRQPILLDLECEDNSQAWQMTLTYTGTPASFDVDGATVVTMQKSDLGIKLYLGGNPFVIGNTVKINGDELTDFEAVLVQRDGVELEEGPFTALATLRAEYQ